MTNAEQSRNDRYSVSRGRKRKAEGGGHAEIKIFPEVKKIARVLCSIGK